MLRYNFRMARGWESKSVEDQQAQAAAGPPAPRAQLTPEQAAAQAQRENLLLARKHLLQQIELARNPQHRNTLQAALLNIEDRLAALASTTG